MSTPIGPVHVVTPGGIRANGGIGRMVSYFSRTWSVADAPMVVVDSYGLGGKARMPAIYALAFTRLTAAATLGRIGMLHVHMAERASVLRKGLVVHLGHAFEIPVVLHLHGADFADFCRGLSPRGRRMVREMVHKADAVVTLGHYWRDFAMAELELPAERVTVLHNAVPGPETVPARDHGGPCRILFLGVLGPRKGVPSLLRALASPALRGFSWQATLAGNGEVRESQARAAELGIGDRLRFTGWVGEDEARRLLAWADLLVLPSRNEGLPMAILEAMAWGLPVVSTPVGAIPDAIEHGINGFLVPVGDDVALAAALAQLVEDPPLRHRMGAAARQRWARDFDITAYNHRLEALFRQVRAKRDGLARQGEEGFAR